MPRKPAENLKLLVNQLISMEAAGQSRDNFTVIMGDRCRMRCTSLAALNQVQIQSMASEYFKA